MPDIERADAFLRQARKDADASACAELPEAVARYLLQQACEKAIKAFGYAKHSASHGDGGQIEQFFFGQHDPLRKLSAADLKRLPGGARLLRRDMLVFLEAFPERAALEKIDATTPVKDPNVVSYRYPFLVDGAWVAPSEFNGWTPYQGGIDQVRTATRKLLAAVKDEVSYVKRR